MFALIRPVLKKELIKVTQPNGNLHEYFSKEILPIEFSGGSLSLIEDVYSNFMKSFEDKR